MSASRTAVYPGTFNPPTVAHLAISEAVRTQRGVSMVTWSVSTTALGKEHLGTSNLEARVSVLEAVAKTRPWLQIQVTDQQLLADIAQDFDVLILGADKWHQIQELHWYQDDPFRRDAAIQKLPELAIAPRPPHAVPESLALKLAGYEAVSSSAAREGATHHILEEARRTGLW